MAGDDCLHDLQIDEVTPWCGERDARMAGGRIACGRAAHDDPVGVGWI